MLLHESCHFYGLQWLICLFKFSIKQRGGELQSRRDAAVSGGVRGEAPLVPAASDPPRPPNGEILFGTLNKSISIPGLFRWCSVTVLLLFSVTLLCRHQSSGPNVAVWLNDAHHVCPASLAVTQKMMYGALRLSSQGPRAFIVCWSDRCFSNDRVPCALCTLQTLSYVTWMETLPYCTPLLWTWENLKGICQRLKDACLRMTDSAGSGQKMLFGNMYWELEV